MENVRRSVRSCHLGLRGGEGTLMRAEVANALMRAEEYKPIRKHFDGQRYTLTGNDGEKRVIMLGDAQTVLGNNGWPKYGKNALLWMYARVS